MEIWSPEFWSTLASFVSIIIAGLAIFISLYFYTQSKHSEKEVSNALESIKAQTEVLQKVTGRQLDRLIKHVTQPVKEKDEGIDELKKSIDDVRESIAKSLHPTGRETTIEIQKQEIVTSYIAIYYYVAVTNYCSQGYLNAGRDPNGLEFYKSIVNESYTDFFIIKGLLNKTDTTLIASSSLNHLYRKVEDSWSLYIKNSEMVLSSQPGQQ